MEIQTKPVVQIDGYIRLVQKTVTTWAFGVSHLVVWAKLAAVDIVVVTSEHSDQLSSVEGIHRYRAAAWHKHKLWAAAT